MTKKDQKVIGVIGLGNMGAGIAANLANAGHNVLGWDLNLKTLKKLEMTSVGWDVRSLDTITTLRIRQIPSV